MKNASVSTPTKSNELHIHLKSGSVVILKEKSHFNGVLKAYKKFLESNYTKERVYREEVGRETLCLDFINVEAIHRRRT